MDPESTSEETKLRQALENCDRNRRSLIEDFVSLAQALGCANTTLELLARVAGLVQLERDVQDAVSQVRCGNWDAFQFYAHVAEMALARPQSQYCRVSPAARATLSNSDDDGA